MQPNRGVRLVLIILFTLLTGYLGLQLAELSFKVHWYEDAVSHFTFKGKGELVTLLIRVLFALLGPVGRVPVRFQDDPPCGGARSHAGGNPAARQGGMSSD